MIAAGRKSNSSATTSCSAAAQPQFDRAVALPVEIDADQVKAEYHDGILALYLPRAERDKPKAITVA